jgi:crossover junction endonuclease EME1
MESGQVKSGENATDTFTRMLQEMTQVTAAVAFGIAAEYPTVRELVKGLERDGPLALQDCKKTANRNGAFTDRRIGPSISKRLHRVFTGRDEWSLNI